MRPRCESCGETDIDKLRTTMVMKVPPAETIVCESCLKKWGRGEPHWLHEAPGTAAGWGRE